MIIKLKDIIYNKLNRIDSICIVGKSSLIRENSIDL